ncbi:MAG: DUF5611 family protein [Thermoplasmatota archaeon]
MQDYEIKRGHQRELEGGGLMEMMREAFGTVHEEGGALVSSYGALARLTVVWEGGGVLRVDAKMNPGVPAEVAAGTISAYNRFLKRATGYSAKERAKRLQKRAKEGRL